MKREKKYIYKTFTWRIIATTITTVIAWGITGDATIGLTVGGIEFFAKMIAYYLHERAWK